MSRSTFAVAQPPCAWIHLLVSADLGPDQGQGLADAPRPLQRALPGPLAGRGPRGRGIRVRHFARFVRHLLETLCDPRLDGDDAAEIIVQVNTHADPITGESSIGA